MTSSVKVQTNPENHQLKGRLRVKMHHKRADFISTIKGRTEKPVIAVNAHHKRADFLSTIKGRTEKSIVTAEESIEDTKIKNFTQGRIITEDNLFP